MLKSPGKKNFNKLAGELLDKSAHPENWKYGERVWFPNIPLTVVQGKKNCPAIAFRTSCKATKFEVHQMVENLYGINVKKVNTLNYEYKKARTTLRGVWKKKGSNYKKAYVFVSETPNTKTHVSKMNKHRKEIESDYVHEDKTTESTEQIDENALTTELQTPNPEPKQN